MQEGVKRVEVTLSLDDGGRLQVEELDPVPAVIHVRHRCRQCSHSLGRYVMWELSTGLIPIEAMTPRTGTSLSLEPWGGNMYIRVNCAKGCRRNEKIPLANYQKSPLLRERGKLVIYL